MMNITGIFKLLSISRFGKDKNGQAYLHINAISCDDQEQYVVVKAFGKQAETLHSNLNSFGVRRAYVAGQLVVSSYETEVEGTMSIVKNGKKLSRTGTCLVPQLSLAIHVGSVQFLDKKPDGSNTKPQQQEDDVDDDFFEDEEDFEEEVAPEPVKKPNKKSSKQKDKSTSKKKASKVESVEVELDADEEDGDVEYV